MVTSNKLPDKKVVKMSEHSASVVVPQRTLLGEVNEHITCPLCRGYYIDATTIVECLHSFCRSCIIKHLQAKSYCPVCEMMINSAKPNIKLDKALQDIVYKLVPGLFQKEMERRQQFYASRPGSAASATPEQRGEDTERIIFSPEDVISFSLEYADATDTDSISSKSSDSNEPQTSPAIARRYLQCPAVVNISHLKKFLSMKFDIDCSQFAIDILYKRVPLPDYYTLMDIAYIYNWKRNEPMRFFYQIIDYVAIRNRLFDITRKRSQFPDRKPSPTLTEDTSVSSPVPTLNDNCSEVSSGTDSPMPTDNISSRQSFESKKKEKPDMDQSVKDNTDVNASSPKKSDDEVEKSQFLNSFELTAKNNTSSAKSSPTKSTSGENNVPQSETKHLIPALKLDDPLKRKQLSTPNSQEIKKLKIELERKVPTASQSSSAPPSNQNNTSKEQVEKSRHENVHRTSEVLSDTVTSSTSLPVTSDTKNIGPSSKLQTPESPGTKRQVPGPSILSSPKRKVVMEIPKSQQPQPVPTLNRTVSPLKLQIPKFESEQQSKSSDTPKPVKKIPDLKPSTTSSQTPQNKSQPVNKVRMDLLANNSDPTIDRSKIMSQVKSSLGLSNLVQTSGDPLKSLFDSCKINIPSSLSITLTDQKDQRNPNESLNTVNDSKINIINKNLAPSNVSTHKVPSPPVHNYIEILKLPDNDPKKQLENSSEVKSSSKSETSTKPAIKPESSAKGPIPNLKPIDPKLSKQSGNFSGPITFQQTFEQQLQSLQSDKKPKPPKSKNQMPKLVPANPKTFNASKLNVPQLKPAQNTIVSITPENKPTTALDLSTPQSNLSSHQTKALETMQTIANLAKKQNLPPRTTTPTSMNLSSTLNRPMSTVGSLRLPPSSNLAQIKPDKAGQSSTQSSNVKTEIPSKQAIQIKAPNNPSSTIPLFSNYQMSTHSSQSTAQASPRSQTRSPSSSPKLVIAEEKQVINLCDSSTNQSNQVTSSQTSNMNAPKSESPKSLPGPSKPVLKPIKSISPTNKISTVRQHSTPNAKPNPAHGLHLFTANQELLRQQLDMSAAWLSAHNTFSMYKNISNMPRQSQSDFNKDKQ